MIPAREALEKLRQGNQRFVSELRSLNSFGTSAQRQALVAGQKPFTVVLGCSDSRVPAEKVFDQGLGDLFVIRVAGNVATPTQIGSVEYAAASLGTQLVVVLGHTHCGAVRATAEDVLGRNEDLSPNLRAIVDRIRPAVEKELSEHPDYDLDHLAQASVQANVRKAMHDLRHDSAILKRLIQEEKLLIVGAEYSLKTGVVDFFAVDSEL